MIWVIAGVLVIFLAIIAPFALILADDAKQALAFIGGMSLIALMVAFGAALIDYGVSS